MMAAPAEDQQNGAQERLRGRIRGCLLGGALGDALGAPLEFLDLANIRSRYGTEGLTEPDVAYGRVGAVTDDTQMTLFTAEGLIRAWVRGDARGMCHPPSVVWHAYLRWLVTQGDSWRAVGGRFYRAEHPRPDGWLVGERWLHARRAPGSTCLAALRSGRMGEIRHPLNDSKGCGGVMRVAPAGLMDGAASGDRWRGDRVDFAGIFSLGCELAAVTHGHASGYYAAGAMAMLVHALVRGLPPEAGLDLVERELAGHHDAEETRRALERGRALAAAARVDAQGIETLGAGWVAEEALAIAVAGLLAAGERPRRALLLAVNHSGDSDSTGALCGALLGAQRGVEALPHDWLDLLEGREAIERLADDLWLQVTGQAPAMESVGERSREANAWWERYPGW